MSISVTPKLGELGRYEAQFLVVISIYNNNIEFRTWGTFKWCSKSRVRIVQLGLKFLLQNIKNLDYFLYCSLSVSIPGFGGIVIFLFF